MNPAHIAFAAATLAAACAAGVERRWLDETEIDLMSSGWGKPAACRSIGGNALRIGGEEFARGAGTHAPSVHKVALGGAALSFEAKVGVDDETGGKGSVVFRVYADGRLVAEAKSERGRAVPLKADLSGARIATLEVTDAADGDYFDHADWADAFFVFKDGAGPLPSGSLTRQLGVLTPKPSAAPRINAPARYGARPGRPILFKLPVAGAKPVEASAVCDTLAIGNGGANAPLNFDPVTRILTGSIEKPGEYRIKFTASNAAGSAQKTVVFVVGDKIALTPPMGWNSWNAFAGGVSAEKMKTAVDKMVELGLDEHGWTYVNIDDFWQKNPENGKSDHTLAGPERNADGTIAPNARFPDMKALADYIHSKGFKAGLYSSPGPYTCGGCTGSWLHELQDAKSYAEWGYDYLKYDWCSYGAVATGTGREYHTRPYFLMGRFLKMQPRDIVFSLCQYGNENVPTWGEQAGGQCWRTTGDVFDTWPSVYGTGVRSQAPHWMYSRPGAWNDADMLVVGRTVWSDGRLTHNECYTHVSMWCMFASPLMIGCDLSLMDEFTLSLLVNDEVIAVDQDELGAAAALVLKDKASSTEVWARPLADGSMAFALLNADIEERPIAFDFARLGMKGRWAVRDLWRQADEGVAEGRYEVSVPGHATHLIKLSPREGAGLKPCLNDIRDNTWRLGFDDDRAGAAPAEAKAPCTDC